MYDYCVSIIPAALEVPSLHTNYNSCVSTSTAPLGWLIQGRDTACALLKSTHLSAEPSLHGLRLAVIIA